jgi:hypothetical protein
MKKFLNLFIVALLCMAVFPTTAFAMNASGNWSGYDGYVRQSGTVNFNFPATGGAVSGTYSGTGDIMSFQFGGRFSGNFEGCWGGKMSGTFSGWYSYLDVFTDELENRIAGGDWTGTLNDNGTITASFGGMSDGGVTANYSTSALERECGPVGGEEPIAEAIVTYAYVIIDGERQSYEYDINTKIDLLPGMTVGIDHDDGLITVDIGTGSEILMMGKGTEITVLTASDIDEDKWSDIVGMQPAGSVVTMSPGQIIVRYNTPDGEEKYWVPDALKDDIDPDVVYGPGGYEFQVRGETDSGISLIAFSSEGDGGDFESQGGLVPLSYYLGGITDTGSRTPPMPVETYAPKEDKGGVWNFFFGNKSEVFYDYDGENVYIEVNQGEVEIWRSDFVGNAELIATILKGESYELNLAEYNEAILEGEDEEDLKDLGLKNVKKESDKTLLYGGVGAGVLILLILIIVFIKKKK